MTLYWNIYATLAVLPLVLALPLAVYTWRRRKTPSAQPLLVFCIVVIWWSLGNMMEHAAPSPQAQFFWVRFEYLGIVLAAPAFFFLALLRAGYEEWGTRRAIGLLLIEPVLTTLVIWGPFSRLFWRSFASEWTGAYYQVATTRGWWFGVHLGYDYLLLVGGSLVLLQALWQRPEHFRGQVFSMLVAALAPLLGNALFIAGLLPIPHWDPTPLTLAFSSLSLAWGIFRHHLIDLTPIAANLVLRQMADGVMVLDSENRIADINRAALHMLDPDLDVASVLGRNVWDVFAPWGAVLERFRGVVNARTEFVLPDEGGGRIFDIRVSPLMGHRNEPLGRVFLVRDVTEERRLQADLRRSNQAQQLLNVILQLGQENIGLQELIERCLGVMLKQEWLVASPRGAIYLWGQQPPRWVLQAASQMEPDPSLDLKNPEAFSAPLYPGINRLPLKNGERRLGILLLDVKSTGIEKAFLYALADTLANAIDRKQSNEALRRHALTFVSLAESVIITDLEGRIVDANPATERMFGYARDELLGQRANLWHHPGQKDRLSREILVGLARDGYWGGEIQFVRKDGFTGWAEIAVVPLLDDAGRRIANIGVSRDVTDRKETERALAAARDAAEEANLAKSVFLANMSHELRTPLNAIIGYAELMEEEAEESGLDAMAQDARRVLQAGQQLLALINDVLDISKIEAGKAELLQEDFSIPMLLDQVASTVHPLMEKNDNRFRIDLSPDVQAMHADQGKVRQSLLNLLSNAAKFTQQGEVTLRVWQEIRDGRPWVVFQVQDTGIGISSPDQIEHLFKPFTQADASTTRKYGGTGLGLALTRRFCEMMGGTVDVESIPAQGSVFTIALPQGIVEKSIGKGEGLERGA
ncbi:MAG: hypothetical protein Fur0018_12370 [Anaerolineales bacterium]